MVQCDTLKFVRAQSLTVGSTVLVMTGRTVFILTKGCANCACY